MSNEWTDLTDMGAVCEAANEGWEIEHSLKGAIWDLWSGDGWAKSLKYRGRPAQPKKVTVKLLGWLSERGMLYQVADGEHCPGWKRVPSEDKTVEVEQ